MASGSAQKSALCKRAPCAARAVAQATVSGSATEDALYSRLVRRDIAAKPRRRAGRRRKGNCSIKSAFAK